MAITGKSMEPSTCLKPQRMQAFMLFGLVRDARGYSALNGISLHRACILRVLFMNFIKCILSVQYINLFYLLRSSEDQRAGATTCST